MSWIVALLAALQAPLVTDSARLVGSTLVVEPIGLSIDLPLEWFGPTDIDVMPCGHRSRGSTAQRLVTSRPGLDSLHNVTGEWDREYAAVADSTLPFADLVAHVGPEPFGGGQCFGDLQMRVYVGDTAVTSTRPAVARGLSTARAFFSSAALVSRDSAAWRIDRLYWMAEYYDYGAEANVEMFSTVVKGRVVTLVFMRATRVLGEAAERDQRFILEHIRVR